jgi:hypothetical protein
MTEHTMTGGTSLAEPPVPMAPASSEPVADDNRRKLAIVSAVVGALVLLVAAFFLLKGNGGSNDQALAPVTRGVPPTAQNGGGKATAQHPIRLPKAFNGAVGRDPFAPLYTPPKAKASAPASTPSGPKSNPGTTPVVVTPGGSTGSSGNPGTTPAASYAPVWVELVSVNGTKSATFVVDYSNGKRTKTTTFKGVTAPTKTLRTTFGHVFALLSIQDGTATVQFGDGTPFDLAKGFGNRHFVG